LDTRLPSSPRPTDAARETTKRIDRPIRPLPLPELGNFPLPAEEGCRQRFTPCGPIRSYEFKKRLHFIGSPVLTHTPDNVILQNGMKCCGVCSVPTRSASKYGQSTYSYSRHFISSCTRVLGYESTPKGVDAHGHVIAVGTFPIGIDADRVNVYRKEPGVMPKMNAIREMYAGKKIIVGRDKLDLVKGVMQKLAAFEKFLIDYPEWRNKVFLHVHVYSPLWLQPSPINAQQVVLIQVTSPALRDSPKLETKVSELVSHINGTYGSLEFTPVHHYHQHIDRDEYYALLSVADIGLITSVRDGMNTTSLEYIICQQENQGPLILSEFTGTAGSLSSAIMVNPWDY
ncbi:hypothetical protein BC936DRAFT_144096, partial [Jimgerdemannia flammicorona]